MRTLTLSAAAKNDLRDLKSFLSSEERKNAFDMAWWGVVIVGNKKKAQEALADLKSGYGVAGIHYDILKKQKPPCGAVHCLAGAMCIMKGLIVPTKDDKDRTEAAPGLIYEMGIDTWAKAAKALGITTREAGALFLLPAEQEVGDYETTEDYYQYNYAEDGNVWPLEWARQYFAASSPKEKLTVALAYLDDVIKNGLQVRDEEDHSG